MDSVRLGGCPRADCERLSRDGNVRRRLIQESRDRQPWRGGQSGAELMRVRLGLTYISRLSILPVVNMIFLVAKTHWRSAHETDRLGVLTHQFIDSADSPGIR